MSTALDPSDQAELEAQVRAELEAEHKEKLEEFERLRSKAKERGRERVARKKEAEEASFRRGLRVQFYEEKGYQLYTDSRGREKWIPREEFEWRQRMRRKADKKHTAARGWVNKHRTTLLYVGLVILAIGLGLYLVQ